MNVPHRPYSIRPLPATRLRRRLPPVVLACSLLLSVLSASPARATFPGEDGRVAVYSDRGGQGFDIWTMEIDGSDPINLTNTAGIDEFSPSWDPSGTMLVFHQVGANGRADILVMPADGSDPPVNLTNSPAVDDAFAQFCDEGSIVFHSNPAGQYDIYEVPVSGGAPERLTDSASSDLLPTCSPDGQKIAFRRDAPGSEIFQMNRDGSDQENLTQDPAGDSDPDYSPDGTTLAFTSTRDTGDNPERNAEIFLMDLTGGTQRGGRAAAPPVQQLTETAEGTHESPHFAPKTKNSVEDLFIVAVVFLDGHRNNYWLDRLANSQAISDGASEDGGAAVQPKQLACKPFRCELRPDGTLVVRGTDGDDDIDLSETLSGDQMIVRNRATNRSTRIPLTDVTGLEVAMGDGADFVHIDGLLQDRFGGEVTVTGEEGNDVLIVGSPVLNLNRPARARATGAPRLRGGPGNDTIKGRRGAQTLVGGPGHDLVVGGKGRDRMKGGSGRDRLKAKDGTRDVVVGGKGRDTAIVDGKDRVRGVERVK